MDEPLTFTVDVGWTDRRPVVPDQHVSRVTVSAFTEAEACVTAALMVMRPAAPHLGLQPVQMPTRTTVVRVVI